MNISEISIRKPVFAWMLMFGLIVFGGVSFVRLGVSQLPDVDFPIVNVSITLEGASPEAMETDVVDIVEGAVMGIQGVKQVTSSAKEGSASVRVEFDLDRDLDFALQDVQAKVAQAQKQLPSGIDPPVISKTNPEDQPILWLTLASDKHSTRELMIYVRDHVKDALNTVSGVGEITLGGYLEPNLRVWVKPDRLRLTDLTITDVLDTLRREHYEPPGGLLTGGNREYSVRVSGEASTVEEFRDLPINFRAGRPNYAPVPLGTVAHIEEGIEDIRRISRGKGIRGVGIGIRKQRGANAVSVANGVFERVEKIRTKLPDGMKLFQVFDTTRFIKDSIQELTFTLLLSALLTAFVCWLFLGSWSSTVNVLMSIPTSIVGTFLVMYFAGFTLNTFTLLALSLAIGIVVDDSIMVLENILRHQEEGMNKVQAALVGSKEITFAAIAATVAIIAIFLPIAFMQGIIGRFLFQFGVVLSVAVALSLLEALTLTPMRCAEFVEVSHSAGRFRRMVDGVFENLANQYRRALGLTLRFRWLALLLAILVFVGSLPLMKKLPREFMPAEDRSQFMIRLTTPVGSSLAYTDRRTRQVEDYLEKRPEVAFYFVAVGGFGGTDTNSAMMFVTLAAKGKRGVTPELGREASQQELMGVFRKALKDTPDTKVVMQDLSMRGISSSRGFPIEFSLKGPEWTEMAKIHDRLTSDLNGTGNFTDLDSNYDVGMPELLVVPDRTKASRRGVSAQDIGDTVRAAVAGLVIAQYPSMGHRYDIRVKLDEKDLTPQSIGDLTVRNNRGEIVPLSSVVTIKQTEALQAINRENRERSISFFANPALGKRPQDAVDTLKEVSAKILPDGYRIELTGSSESFNETIRSVVFALLLGIGVAYMVLASQFNSFIDPISILIILPFSLTGALVGLALGHQSINLYSMIGLILLMGIVKKNSILLVDFTNQVRDKGQASVTGALLEACPVRLRPILMTSLATIAGAIPPAMAVGPGAESRIPMAVAILGGVSVSTVLSLFVVPCVYSVLTRERKHIVEPASDR